MRVKKLVSYRLKPNDFLDLQLKENWIKSVNVIDNF